MELTLGKHYISFFGCFLIAFIFSCTELAVRIRHYSYRSNIVVSRVDSNKKTYLFYGYCDNPDIIKRKSDVVIDWEFDDFLKATVIFLPNGKVEVLSGGGGKLHQVGNNKAIYFKEYNSRQYWDKMEEFEDIDGSKTSVDLNDNLNFEELENKKQKSEIKITDKNVNP